MNQFRFKSPEIVQPAVIIDNQLCKIAEQLEIKKKFRFTEQLNRAALTISNHMADDRGAHSNKRLCKDAHRPVFENTYFAPASARPTPI